jgi:PAS domain S-box-containing protein
VTSDGRFVFEGLNPAHERATGLSFGDIVGKEPEQCLPPAVAAAVTSRYRACLDAGEPALYDEVLDLPSGRRFWQTSLAPVRDPDSGRIVTLVGTARDVTAYREATARAERSQRLLQATLDALSAHVAILNGRGDIIAVNQAWRSFGTGNGLAVPDHAIGTNYIEVCRAAAANDPRAAVVARGLAALLDGERPEFRSSYRCGDRYFQMTAAQFDHDGGVYAVVAHEDVTEMVVARHDVRDIARRLLSLQEEERQRIAADLHDSTAQHLAAAGLALMHVGGVAGNRSKVEKALEPVWLSLDKAQQEIRTLSFLLYPPGLRTEGLAASLWQLLNGFSEQTGIDGTANVSGEVDGVPFEVKRSILRVAQEALINVHRHAAATRVSLSLDLSENTLRLAVADYGKGYVTATNDGSAASSLGVGIPGMEARIRHFNGTLEIVGGQGGGTTVRATVPLQVDSF